MSSVEAFTKGEGDVGDRVISGCSDTVARSRQERSHETTDRTVQLDGLENQSRQGCREFSWKRLAMLLGNHAYCFLATNYIHHGSPSPVHPDAGLRRLRHGMWHTCQPVNLTAYSFLTAEFTCALSRCAWLVSAHAFCAAPLRHTCRLHANLRVHLRLMQHLRTYRVPTLCALHLFAADLSTLLLLTCAGPVQGRSHHEGQGRRVRVRPPGRCQHPR